MHSYLFNKSLFFDRRTLRSKISLLFVSESLANVLYESQNVLESPNPLAIMLEIGKVLKSSSNHLMGHQDTSYSDPTAKNTHTTTNPTLTSLRMKMVNRSNLTAPIPLCILHTGPMVVGSKLEVTLIKPFPGTTNWSTKQAMVPNGRHGEKSN